MLTYEKKRDQENEGTSNLDCSVSPCDKIVVLICFFFSHFMHLRLYTFLLQLLPHSFTTQQNRNFLRNFNRRRLLYLHVDFPLYIWQFLYLLIFMNF